MIRAVNGDGDCGEGKQSSLTWSQRKCQRSKGITIIYFPFPTIPSDLALSGPPSIVGYSKEEALGKGLLDLASSFGCGNGVARVR